MSSTSAVPYTCTQGPPKSSERTQMLTSGSRRVLRVFALCGYVDTTMRPSGSTPQLTGESCGLPSHTSSAVGSTSTLVEDLSNRSAAQVKWRPSTGDDGSVPAGDVGPSCRIRNWYGLLTNMPAPAMPRLYPLSACG